MMIKSVLNWVNAFGALRGIFFHLGGRAWLLQVLAPVRVWLMTQILKMPTIDDPVTAENYAGVLIIIIVEIGASFYVWMEKRLDIAKANNGK